VTIVTASSSSSSSSCHQKNGAVLKTEGEGVKEDERETSATSPRRRVLKNAMSAAAGGVLFFCGGFGEKRANAGVMGSIAGRVPGFGKVGSDGSMWYTRPEAKSGGHGIGWTDITPYSLKLREGWEEVAVSIADPGGTEIDTRFKNESEGDVKIVLAPVLRFANVQDGENPTIEELVPITNLILGFAPEVLGQPVNEEQIKSMEKDTRNGLTHYNYEISNDAHWLISATVWKKRVYLCAVHANGRQWRTAQPKLRETIESFVVVK
jgi:hypothetical protein|tara:strand:+ start:383 stop:1177 length:795 start_codon:yes stop_codon:yes gene_type:complete